MIRLVDILREVAGNFKQDTLDLINANFKRYDASRGKPWRGEMFSKVKNNPNFVVIPSREMGKTHRGDANRCETNTFNYIKRKLDVNTWSRYKDDPDNSPEEMVEYLKGRYFPVAGYQVTEGGGLVEHWWVYDKHDDKHMETCPFDPNELHAYVGFINYDIQDDIIQSDHVFDVDFFKGGNPYYWYFK